MPVLVKILRSAWLIFFLINIAVLGSTAFFLLYFPLTALSYLLPQLRSWPDGVLKRGVALLMWIQPWFNAEMDLPYPRCHSGGILFVSNHRSHLDVFILLARIAGIRVLAKKSLFRVPFLGFFMRASGQIGVERGELKDWLSAMDEVRKRLRQGERVHIFPEMTRCEPGANGVRSFRAAPFLAAMQEDAMVIPIVFQGTDLVWPKGQLGLSFRAPVRARTLEALRAKDFPSVNALMTETHTRIEQALQ